MVTPLSWNATRPVAVDGVTVAVNNVAEPKTVGFTDDVRVVVVPICWIVSE
jgi:hypothetical protein